MARGRGSPIRAKRGRGPAAEAEASRLMYGIPSRIHVLKSTLLRALNWRAEALNHGDQNRCSRGKKKRNTKKRRPYLAEEALIPSNQVVASLDILTMKTLCQHSLLQNFRGTSSQGGSFCGCKPEEGTRPSYLAHRSLSLAAYGKAKRL